MTTRAMMLRPDDQIAELRDRIAHHPERCWWRDTRTDKERNADAVRLFVLDRVEHEIAARREP